MQTQTLCKTNTQKGTVKVRKKPPPKNRPVGQVGLAYLLSILVKRMRKEKEAI
ncbi:MAG: hypothetical protein LBG19_03895 [Prevotellaceae bacterium]|nr:hypothetical protein [Prevotellaceae bacterium]